MCQRVLGDVRREFLQRVCDVPHGALDSYVCDAKHGGCGGAVTRFTALWAYNCSYRVSSRGSLGAASRLRVFRYFQLPVGVPRVLKRFPY
jgi:hypothetical protein